MSWKYFLKQKHWYTYSFHRLYIMTSATGTRSLGCPMAPLQPSHQVTQVSFKTVYFFQIKLSIIEVCSSHKRWSTINRSSKNYGLNRIHDLHRYHNMPQVNSWNWPMGKLWFSQEPVKPINYLPAIQRFLYFFLRIINSTFTDCKQKQWGHHVATVFNSLHLFSVQNSSRWTIRCVHSP